MEVRERQLNPALSNLHYLVCRTMGQTPHTLFLGFSRRSPFLDLPNASHTGNLPNPSNDPEPSVPGWMQEGAEALLGRAVRTKEESLVDPVVIEEVISPYVVRVLRPSGLEETVSSRRIAPYPRATETTPVAVPPRTAEVTKAPQSLDVQDQPMSPETLPPEAGSPSEQGHPIPIFLLTESDLVEPSIAPEVRRLLLLRGVCGVYPLYVENADYAIMLIYYAMLCLVRLSSSPRCSSCLNSNTLTSCVDSSSSGHKLGMLFFRLFFICIDVNCCALVEREIIKEFYKSYRWSISHSHN